MLTRLATLAIVTLLGAAPVGAQSQRTGFDACLERTLPYAGWIEPEDPRWELALEATDGGALRYVGARHATDPFDPQLDRIAAAWDSLDPTVAFFEGPDRGFAETRDETIRRFGESGFVRWLADRDGIPVSSLEPDPLAEAEHLRSRFPDDRVALFYLLREASRLRERRGLGGPEIERAIAALLERAASMGLLGDDPPTVDDLPVMYARYWSEPAVWWHAPAAWFDPLGDPAVTGGRFTHAVNRASSEFRNRHMASVLATEVHEGERVFAVVGRNHVPMQAPALACAIDASG